ncbi:ABC transporter substrate-binding protein [Deinococcus maricopensis]|uniref:ABC-type transporter, periplasmic subunit n=1 Tax=Deinococcus maricopensis (strain DSM 21211 / LMG 22137 / NRRL B-23946 / LB-34) TaxID=709986 RepID=E8U5I9_DEIML|nr:iron-siderophore ABC transporter substrate-binding protein [Deinococcus maricopensis]ADV66328.1 ABC-type transporter, periplasmic subunit [Deinococcus maricopensis DSM 21211]
MKRLLPLLLTAALGTAAAQDTSCTGRTVKHAMGTTCVPNSPKRVIVLDTGELDSVLALGVKPVGAVTALGSGFPTYLKGRTDGVADVGTIQQPSLERILALKPDLILSSKLRHGNLYAQLSRIAPTVMAETVGVVWKDNLKLDARALGREAQANKLLSTYYARLKKLQVRVDRKRTTISVLRFVPGQVRLMQRANFIGTILDDAGLLRPATQRKDTFSDVISAEGLPAADGSVLFYSTYGPADATDQRAFLSSPLWARLNAVRNKRAFAVNDDHWFLGIGILAANRVLDDLEQYLGN